MQFNTDMVILQPISLGKTDRPTHLGSPITVLSFPEDSYVFPVLCLKLYILSSNNFRGKCTSLFIATKQPYKPVSSKTVANWICYIIRQLTLLPQHIPLGLLGLQMLYIMAFHLIRF